MEEKEIDLDASRNRIWNVSFSFFLSFFFFKEVSEPTCTRLGNYSHGSLVPRRLDDEVREGRPTAYLPHRHVLNVSRTRNELEKMERRDKKKASLEKREDFFFLLREIEERGDINRRDTQESRKTTRDDELSASRVRWRVGSMDFLRVRSFRGREKGKKKKKGRKERKRRRRYVSGRANLPRSSRERFEEKAFRSRRNGKRKGGERMQRSTYPRRRCGEHSQ